TELVTPLNKLPRRPADLAHPGIWLRVP
ncbi:MAG: hypothetical protein K0S19_1688, partial [Geminicoccaceae bacterium]|nr:hypothetical protein [Geminicoccaceae bacterium]